MRHDSRDRLNNNDNSNNKSNNESITKKLTRVDIEWHNIEFGQQSHYQNWKMTNVHGEANGAIATIE